MTCPVCSTGKVEKHCHSPTCTWWRCPRCQSYGDKGTMWDGIKKQGRKVSH